MLHLYLLPLEHCSSSFLFFFLYSSIRSTFLRNIRGYVYATLYTGLGVESFSFHDFSFYFLAFHDFFFHKFHITCLSSLILCILFPLFPVYFDAIPVLVETARVSYVRLVAIHVQNPLSHSTNLAEKRSALVASRACNYYEVVRL